MRRVSQRTAAAAAALLLAVVCALPASTVAQQHAQFLDDAKQVKLSWDLDVGGGSIAITLTYSGTGWVGFGVGTTMVKTPNTVAVLGLAGSGDVEARNLTDYAANALILNAVADAELSATSVTQADSTTTLSFTRPVSSALLGDISTSGSTHVIYAYGSSNTLAYHSSRGKVEVDFAAGPDPVVHTMALNDDASLTWDLYEAEERVRAVVSYSGVGFVAFGVGTTMVTTPRTVAVIGLPDDDTADAYSLTDFNVAGIEANAAATAELTDASIVQSGGTTVLSFTRSFTSANLGDLSTTGDTSCVFSYGNDNDLAYHRARGIVAVNWIDGPPPPDPGSSSGSGAGSSSGSGSGDGGGGSGGGGGGSDFTVALEADMSLSWETDADTNLITFTLVYTGDAWVGFGVGDAMIGSVAVIGDPGASTVTARTLAAKAAGDITENTDGTEELTAASVTQAGGSTTLTFTRPLSSTALGDISSTGETSVIYARGASNAFAYHAVRGITSINFATGSAETLSPYTAAHYIHGLLMGLAWAVCVPMGSAFGFGWKHDHPWRFFWHRRFQVTAASFTAIAFIIALVMVDGAHFSSDHTLFGIVVVALTLVHIIVAVIRPHPADKGGDPVKRARWFLAHRSLGMFLTFFAYFTVLTGIVLADVGVAAIVCWALGGAAGAAWCVAGLVNRSKAGTQAPAASAASEVSMVGGDP